MKMLGKKEDDLEGIGELLKKLFEKNTVEKCYWKFFVLRYSGAVRLKNKVKRFSLFWLNQATCLSIYGQENVATT